MMRFTLRLLVYILLIAGNGLLVWYSLSWRDRIRTCNVLISYPLNRNVAQKICQKIKQAVVEGKTARDIRAQLAEMCGDLVERLCIRYRFPHHAHVTVVCRVPFLKISSEQVISAQGTLFDLQQIRGDVRERIPEITVTSKAAQDLEERLCMVQFWQGLMDTMHHCSALDIDFPLAFSVVWHDQTHIELISRDTGGCSGMLPTLILSADMPLTNERLKYAQRIATKERYHWLDLRYRDRIIAMPEKRGKIR